MPNARFASLQGHKYISLETFRKNGQGVRTPVWFGEEPQPGPPEKLYAYSIEDSGKAKRIRNNGKARVAACDGRGKLIGEWVEARAEIVTGAEAQNGMKLLDKKYFPWRQILGFFSRFSSKKRVVFAIYPARDA